jgi:hypothetical protein
MDRVPPTCKSNEYGGASDHCKGSHGVAWAQVHVHMTVECGRKYAVRIVTNMITFAARRINFTKGFFAITFPTSFAVNVVP